MSAFVIAAFDRHLSIRPFSVDLHPSAAFFLSLLPRIEAVVRTRQERTKYSLAVCSNGAAGDTHYLH
jgi:hypothetical protein